MTTRDKLAFAVEMGRRTRATVRQCEALLRYAAGIKREHYNTCNGCLDCSCKDRREYLKGKVAELCHDISELNHNRPNSAVPLFSGATLKIRTPDGGEVEVPA